MIHYYKKIQLSASETLYLLFNQWPSALILFARFIVQYEECMNYALSIYFPFFLVNFAHLNL